ncbi:putative oxidoreductase [Pseudoalteromonas holothuriae]|uniref:Oxidoreductase n=1 Tax=Pseudoalteromonas holothuriae TaxID=2963714 RepID=A0A9W4QR38_9GAMM|nr:MULTISPECIES: SDR family NAD(P)-dependent oxidoreductase [unclassified Pseudoalteromonas]CAH9049672.1 putative oxidoreductase [Pseudoalteromonas sp. CIP111854]CAH9051593.1 putative oxidoreductase [Pseudoalteromonas sp. CIP111951]
MQLSENTILITGGTSGIGLEMARAFLELGNTVIITGRNEQKLQQAQSQLDGVHTIKSDVSNPDDIQILYDEVSKNHPKLNMLINNAGMMLKVNLQSHSHSAQSLVKEIDINVKGPIWMVDKFLPLLKQNSNAAIVNVSSALAFVPMPVSPIYSATKSALHFYTLSLREQLRNTDIKVFELAPPGTKTELLDGFSAEDMQGSTAMSVAELVADLISGLNKNKDEIRPGQSNQLKFMSRFFPQFILKMMSKSVDDMHKS